MDAKGPTAKPEEVEDYLRNLGASDWGASLDVPVEKRVRRRPSDKPPAKPKRPPKALPAPKLSIRAAKPADSAALVDLIALLEHKVDETGVRKRISALTRAKLAPLVATLGKQVVGLCGIDEMTAIHRDAPVGRINILVVAAEARTKGIGRKLVAAAEDLLRERGCVIVEVTSNDRLTEAHAFYRHMGYERTSIRFCKTL